MKAHRAALARAVDSVVDDTADVDWGLMTIELDDVRDRELLRHIRLLSQISEIQKAQPGAADEAQLRARAYGIVRRLPAEPPPAPDASTAPAGLDEAPAVARWGRLELLERVGKGTFGDVFRARDQQLERDVAVKLLHGGGSRRALVSRLLQEARALARVHHRNVVVIHDAEERDGRAGLCMEFIRGRTLAEILAAEGPRGAGEAALIGQDVCRALAAVHAAGLLHRDIKAQNVMREDGGRVVLMDFGAGLPVTEDPARAASITGTPLYLAPEVLERGEASARSDVYSVGVLLYHLVTGDFPVRGRGPSEILEAHAHGQVKRLGDVAPALDSWLVRVVERATAHDPRDRYATAGELEAALARRRAPLSIWPIVTAAGLTLAVALGVQQ
jgi:serine/threonine-protein kinase